MILPLVCSTVSDPVTIPTPPGREAPPSKVLCPTCNGITSSEFRKNHNRCEICFCLCLPCGSSYPYIACTSCHSNLSGNEVHNCSSCGVATTAIVDYCPNCGSRKT